MKADTGASRHFIKEKHQEYLSNLTEIDNGPCATLPDNTKIHPTYVGELPITATMTKQAKEALVYPKIENESLLSIGQLCDDNCVAIFTRQNLYILKDGVPILEGKRNYIDRLWDVHLKSKTNENSAKQKEQLNYIVLQNQTKRDLAQFLHACAFSPAVSTLQAAISKGNFITWPGINTVNFKKLIKTTTATAKGHLDQERANLRSTKNTIDMEPLTQKDHFLDKEDKKTYHCYATAIAAPESNKTYSDQTGRFPFRSSRGNSYIFVMYVYDANGILVQAVKDRKGSSLTAAWKQCQTRLTKHGHRTCLHILDNEISPELGAALDKEQIAYQLAPPGMHRTIIAERAIRTYKNHLLAGLATCHPNYPIREWDRILVQSELTLNLLRNSRINPKLSSWAYLFGNHDFNKVPLLPPGTQVIIHSKPNDRKSWDYHGVDGWYIGPAEHHYRCVKCYVPKTHAERITDTIAVIPRNIPIPKATLDEHVRATSENLISLLANKKNPIGPCIKASTRDALIEIAQVLNRDDIVGQFESPTSEGDTKQNRKALPQISSSEGEKTTEQENDAGKKPQPDKQQQIQHKKRMNPFSRLNGLIEENIKVVDQKKFNKFLRTYVRENNRHRQKRTNKITKTPSIPPKTYRLNVPTPKQRHKHKTVLHPMKLRHRTTKYFPKYGTNFKHLAAQHILQTQHKICEQMNHIYNDNGT